MKIRTFEALALLPVLAGAKMSKLESAEKTAVVRAVVALRSESKRWEEFVREAQERCRPEGYAELAEKYRAKDTLEAAERAETERRWAEYSEAVDEVVRPEYEAERDVPGIGLGAETIGRLADSNPEWTAGTVAALAETLTAPQEGQG
ncbi:MAG: hypothetical protein NC391_11120 [Alistipes timonensis]|nr:hypothetical protein [Alistipes timonensis]